MANGTVTMEVVSRAMNIGWGDEVLIPAYTFQATAAAVTSVGAIPVIVDVDEHTYCIETKSAQAAITPQTLAIIPVDLGAEMADMDAVMELAARVASLIDYGRPHDEAEEIYIMGVNYRLFELQSALGIVGFERFPSRPNNMKQWQPIWMQPSAKYQVSRF
jgi:dTDP-4-amino-4,6-dideoxygalactose transaminase